MQIGIISTMEGAPWGASEELWAATARCALAEGHRVSASVVRWRPRSAPLQALADADVRLFEPRRWKHPRLNRLADHLRFRHSGLLRLRPDVLLISQGATHDLPPTLGWEGLETLMDKSGPPMVIVCNGNRDDRVLDDATRGLQRAVFARAAKVCFVAEHNRLTAQRQLASDIPNATLVRVPLNLADQSVAPWPEGGLARFCCVARLDSSGKGHDALLAALATEPWKNRPWELRFCGSGPDERYLRELVEYLGLTQRVRFLGHVSDIRGVWADNHLMVLASRGEGTSLVMTEAMLCGRPCLITDVGDNAAWVEEGVTGFVAEAPTPRSVGGALERAWAAQARWRAMGLAAHDLAAARVDPDPGRSMLRLLVAAAQEAKR